MAATEQQQSPSLRWLAIRGSGYEVLGFGTAQLLRLLSNLVLARILAPEAFGLLALVSLFQQGLYMFSDLGILPAVVQNERGDEPRFLNTAWTLQLTRGVILGAIALLLAWPMSMLYDEPRLGPMMAVGAIGVLSYGLTSSALYSLRRNVQIAPLMWLELGVQVVAIAITISLALLLRSGWALVLGLVGSSLARTASSYLLPAKHRHQLVWDADSVRSIRGFGKWIFLASSVTFLSRQGDRLLLGKLLGVHELGVYSVAVMLSEAMTELVTRITHGVVFPVLSRVREEGIERMRYVYYRVRLALDLLSMPALGLLVSLGSSIVDLLYDDRYEGAGWMLEVLVVRVAMMCMLLPAETCLTSLGKTQYSLLQGLCRTAWILVFVPLGFHFFGLRGLVWGMALSELPVAFVLWPPLRAAGVLRLRREAIGPLLFVGGYVLGRAFEALLP
jgi:O-antigen/teichoic acid export membrane protein